MANETVVKETTDLQELLSQLEEYVSRKRYSDLKLSEIVYRLSLYLSWEDFEKICASRGWKELIKKHQWKAYIRIYDYWVVQAKMPIEGLENLGITKLHLVAQAQLPPEQAPIWKEKALSLSSRKLAEEIRAEIRKQPLREPFRQISVPESVYESFQRSLVRLRDVLRDSKISPTSYLAWLSEFVLNAPESFLRESWAILHGEYRPKDEVVQEE